MAILIYDKTGIPLSQIPRAPNSMKEEAEQYDSYETDKLALRPLVVVPTVMLFVIEQYEDHNADVYNNSCH